MSHLTDENLIKLKCGRADFDNKIKALEHISVCPYCSDRFATLCEEDKIPLPGMDKQKLLKTAKIYHPLNRNKREFKSYCVKTCIACVCAIALVTIFKPAVFTHKKEPELKISNMVLFNQKIDNMKEFFTLKEYFDYEKTK